jgi:hypothetical protein
VRAVRAAVPAVNVNFAVDVPEFAAATENVVDPQPETVHEVEVIVNVGNVTIKLSPDAISTLNAKRNDMDVGAAVTGFEKVRSVEMMNPVNSWGMFTALVPLNAAIEPEELAVTR